MFCEPKPQIEININIGQPEDAPYLPCPIQSESLLGILKPQHEESMIIEGDPCKDAFGFNMPDFLKRIFDLIEQDKEECFTEDEDERKDKEDDSKPHVKSSYTSIVSRPDLSDEKFHKPMKDKEDKDNDKYSKYWFK